MKIAFLNIYNGRIHRGSEVFVDRLASMLSDQHKITVYQTGKKTNSTYRVHTVSGIPLIPHQGNHSILLRFIVAYIYKLLVLWFTIQAVPHLWKQRYDWIIPVNGGSQVLICRLIRFLRGGKILISGHAGVGRDDRWNIMVGKPDMFVALTPAAYTWAVNIKRTSHVVYIPNGVDGHLFSSTGPVAAIDLPEPRVLCVSALLAYKRVELLIAAVAKVPDVSLVVIGDGPMRKSLEAQASKLLGQRFLHIPHVPHEDIAPYYRACQVFSLPSKAHEAFGLVYLEAMSCNIPVVAPDDESRQKLIGPGGMTCAVEDSTLYAQTLELALKKNFGEAPREQAQRYSWTYIAEQYEHSMSRFGTV